MYHPRLTLTLAYFILGGFSFICQASDKLITLDLKSVHNGELFYAQVETGLEEENKQSFKLLISTSYPLTWLPSIELSPTRGYRNRSGDEYDQTAHHRRIIGTQDMGFLFHVHYDTMQVGSQSIERQPFALAYPCGYPRPLNLGFDGMLGLGDGEPENVDYLFNNLFKQRYIDHLMYSLYINNTAVANNRRNNDDDEDNQQPEGALVLGGIDSKYYTGDFKYVDLHGNEGNRPHFLNRWLYISNIQLDWSRVDEEKRTDLIGRLGGKIQMEMSPSTKLLLESSLKLFIGQKKILDYIHESIIGANRIIRDNFYVFNDCRLDNKPDIVFTIGEGVDVAITPEEYMIEHQLNGQQMCLSAFKPSLEDVWSLGMRFLRKYYTVFDQENHRVGFAKPT